jgi:AcrR family transcriptional regulator
MNAHSPVPAAPVAVDSAQRDTPKSRRTRRRILDAAMKLFAEAGYQAATNADIAAEAKLTRGAMLYHFPTREALVEAAVAHIQQARLTLFEKETDHRDEGADPTDHAIDTYWALLQSTPFRAFAELEAVARTDETMRNLLADARAEFDRAQVGDHSMALIHAGVGPRLQASRDLARFMLEGLAQADLTYDGPERTERLLAVVKRVTHMLNRKGGVSDLWPE